MKTLATAWVVLGLLVFVPACYCGQAIHRNEIVCVVEHDLHQRTIDCTKGAIAEVLPGLKAIFLTLISGSTHIDWSEMESRSKDAGIKDAGCMLAAVADELRHRLLASRDADGAAQAQAQSLTEGFSLWKERRGLSGVKFKLLVDAQEVYR